MASTRIFHSADYAQLSDGEPVRSVITQSPEAVVVIWHVKPGQRVAGHVHPHGQDTWTVLSGRGAYLLDGGGTSRPIAAGDVAVARAGEVHGVYNAGAEPLVFISVVSPADAGFVAL